MRAGRVYYNATQAKAWAQFPRPFGPKTGCKVRQAPGLSPAATLRVAMRAGLVRLPTSPLVHNRSRHRQGLRRTQVGVLDILVFQSLPTSPEPESFRVRGQRSLFNALLTNHFGSGYAAL
jgi:hypothetical protein